MEGSKMFQLGHFLAEMDRKLLRPAHCFWMRSFNWATSQQKWIEASYETLKGFLEMFQLGHFLAEMDRMHAVVQPEQRIAVSIGPLLSRNGQN